MSGTQTVILEGHVLAGSVAFSFVASLLRHRNSRTRVITVSLNPNCRHEIFTKEPFGCIGMQSCNCVSLSNMQFWAGRSSWALVHLETWGGLTMHLELSVIKYIKPSTPRCTASTEAPSFPARQHHGLTQQCFWCSTQLPEHHNWSSTNSLCPVKANKSKKGIEIKKKKKKKDFVCVIFNDCKAEWGGSRWWRSYLRRLHRSWDLFLSWGTPARCDRTLRPLRTKKKKPQPTHKDLCLVDNAQNMTKLHSYLGYDWAWQVLKYVIYQINTCQCISFNAKKIK